MIDDNYDMDGTDAAQTDAEIWDMLNNGDMSMDVVDDRVYIEVTARGRRRGVQTI